MLISSKYRKENRLNKEGKLGNVQKKKNASVWIALTRS